MGKVVSVWFDVAIAVLFLAMCMLNLTSLAREWQTPICDVIEDKSMRHGDLSSYVNEDTRTGKDLLFALMVADEYTPYPKSIRINDTPIIDFVPDWYTRKAQNVNGIYSVYGDYKLANLLDKNIETVEYVPNNGDPYWHYIIK